MKWFKHPSDHNQRAGMKKLRLKYGAQGLGLYWYCVELIAQPIDKHMISFELEHDVEILAQELSIDTLLCDEMMRYMCRPDVALFITDQMGQRIFCFWLAQAIERSIIKNPALKLVQEALRNLGRGQVTVEDILKLPGLNTGNPGLSGTSPDNPGQVRLDVDVDVDVDVDPPPPPNFNNKYDGKALRIDYAPGEALTSYLGDAFHVPPSYVEDYALRFAAYWQSARAEKPSWASVFIEQCSQRWEKEKSTYLDGEFETWSPITESG